MDRSTLSTNGQVVFDSIQRIWNNAEFTALPEFYTPDFVSHQSGHGPMDWVPGLGGIEGMVLGLRALFPDWHEDPQIILSDGDYVVVRQNLSGAASAQNPFAEEGRRFETSDMFVCRMADGKLAEQWGTTDWYSALVDLGSIDDVTARR
jgi:predicted ester cyclase